MSVPAALLERVRRRLAEEADATTADDAAGSAGASPAALRAAVADALREEGVALSDALLPSVVREIADHIGGLGPLEALLRRPGITDVMLNGAGEVWVELHGTLTRVDATFADDVQALRAAAHVVSRAGQRLDRAQPFADAQLSDGTRLHAVIAPVADAGVVITLRRFGVAAPTWAQLEASGSVPAEVRQMLLDMVAAKQAIVVCGRTGSGKTTLLQHLIEQVGDERVVLIEDSPELRPRIPHLVRLRTRAASAEGTGEVRIADLVRQSLRMRPDRIVIGEVRGVEIADVLQALITGHEGCMTTVHARSAAQAVVRLEGMALQAGLPLQARW